MNYVSISLHRRRVEGCDRLTIFMQSCVPLGPGKSHVVVLVEFNMAVARADLVGSTSTFTLCIQQQEIWETREMICYVLAMGKEHLGPHAVVGYGIKIFCPGLFITSLDHLV